MLLEVTIIVFHVILRWRTVGSGIPGGWLGIRFRMRQQNFLFCLGAFGLDSSRPKHVFRCPHFIGGVLLRIRSGAQVVALLGRYTTCGVWLDDRRARFGCGTTDQPFYNNLRGVTFL